MLKVSQFGGIAGLAAAGETPLPDARRKKDPYRLVGRGLLVNEY